MDYASRIHLRHRLFIVLGITDSSQILESITMNHPAKPAASTPSAAHPLTLDEAVKML